jgi:hypothetical protein
MSSGASMRIKPLLMEFRLKISPNEPQMTSGIPACLMAVAACSRDEPVPKLYPENRIDPDREEEEGLGRVDLRSRTVAANSGS